jgi:4a-hydroxytetrahydrobiopterin dehydratase
VRRVGELADAANQHPDVDLRRAGVHVRLLTHELPGLSDRDVDLARRISEAARALGLVADPAAVQAGRPGDRPSWLLRSRPGRCSSSGR